MGDKIVKSENLCCQCVVFPRLSLLKPSILPKTGWAIAHPALATRQLRPYFSLSTYAFHIRFIINTQACPLFGRAANPITTRGHIIPTH